MMALSDEELKKKEEELKEEVKKLEERKERLEERERELGRRREVEPASVDEIVEEKLRQRGSAGGGGGGGGGFNVWSLLMPLVISIVVVLGMTNFGLAGVSVDQFNKSMDAIAVDMSAVRGSVDTGNASIEQLASEVGVIKQNLMESYVTKKELDSVVAPDLSGYVTVEQWQVLQDQVTALQQTQSTTDTTTNGVTATIKTQFFEYVEFPAENTPDVTVPPDGKGDGPWNEVSVALRLTLVNNTGRDITDVKVAIDFVPYMYQAISWESGYPQLGGGATTWTRYGLSSYGLVFVNGWGLSLDAGETESIDLVLLMKANADHGGVRWTPDVTVEDYD